MYELKKICHGIEGAVEIGITADNHVRIKSDATLAFPTFEFLIRELKGIWAELDTKRIMDSFSN